MSKKLQDELIDRYIADKWEVEPGKHKDYNNSVTMRRLAIDHKGRDIWKRVTIYTTGNCCNEPDQFQETKANGKEET